MLKIDANSFFLPANRARLFDFRGQSKAFNAPKIYDIFEEKLGAIKEQQVRINQEADPQKKAEALRARGVLELWRKIIAIFVAEMEKCHQAIVANFR